MLDSDGQNLAGGLGDRLTTESIEEGRSRFVVGVLGDEFAAEGGADSE
jgi:hypothetical protein